MCEEVQSENGKDVSPVLKYFSPFEIREELVIVISLVLSSYAFPCRVARHVSCL